MMRKPRLTVTEHVALGFELAEMFARFQHITVHLNTCYPKSDPVCNYAWRAVRALRDVRNVLNKAAYHEHGNDIPVDAYFGVKSPDRARRVKE